MASSLSSAAKARQAAKNAAKAAKSSGTKSNSKPAKPSTPSSSGLSNQSSSQVATKTDSVTVPGLVTITPNDVAGMLPTFNKEQYAISDPLNPSPSMPQITQVEYEERSGIYKGAQRALRLTGDAFDTAREKFSTIIKQAKAYGEGIKSATEFEKVRGNYIDYLNQLQTNEQKTIALDISQHKTTTDRTKATHSKSEMDEKLKQAEIAAEKAQEETKQKQSDLDAFRKQLGTLAKAS
jgi:hypothetical protein